MVDTGIFCTTSEVQAKVGVGASTTYNAEAYINSFVSQAESTINVITMYNWSDAYSGLNVDKKGILKETASDMAAIYVMNSDPSGFTNLREYQSRIDILNNNIVRNLAILKEIVKSDFLRTA